MDDNAHDERLAQARERAHILEAVDRAQSDWRIVLESLASADSPDAAQDVLQTTFGFTRVQAIAVMDVQFRRVTKLDRERISSELAALRTEIAGLEGDL